MHIVGQQLWPFIHQQLEPISDANGSSTGQQSLAGRVLQLVSSGAPFTISGLQLDGFGGQYVALSFR